MIEKIKKEIDKKLFAFKEVNSNELIKVISLEDISKILEKQLALTDVVSCEALKIKELMTFKDYRKNLFIKADGVYQPKNTKLFAWYSKKQLKKMYNNEPL